MSTSASFQLPPPSPSSGVDEPSPSTWTPTRNTNPLVTCRDTLRAISPPWLQTGWAEKVLYSIGVVADALGDAAVAAVKARFPGAVTYETLPLIGHERRIRRGRLEPDATYAGRLLRWRKDHRRRGGPYALLEQLHAFYAPLNFPVELRYANGRSFTLALDGSITRGDVTWTPPGLGGAERWARWWLIYTWPAAVDVPKWGDGGRWGDGGVWGAKLTAQQVRDLRMVPRDWGNAHSIGRITLITPLRTVTISAEG